MHSNKNNAAKNNNSERPLILISNDDGYGSRGLEILAAHLEQIGDTVISAPAHEQSAVGHGLSLNRPLRVITHGPCRHSVTGTPADSVVLGIFRLCARRPDLVVSGINLGLNLGIDVFYSGTVAGALEGAIHGIQSIAVSQELPSGNPQAISIEELDSYLERTAAFAAALAAQVLANPLPPRIALNVNAPAQAGTKFSHTCLGQRVYREKIEQREDLRGIPYYWIGGPVEKLVNVPGTDAYAMEHGMISITALGLNPSIELPVKYRQLAIDGFDAVQVNSAEKQRGEG